MRIHLLWIAALFGGLLAGWCEATEPNETFAERTILSPGVTLVEDELATSGPDTYLGTYRFGSLYEWDDNSSPYGDGYASALYIQPFDNGYMEFRVTGSGDFGFTGDHFESGSYVAYVSVYEGNDLIDSLELEGTLEPGEVDTYTDFDLDWLFADYDVAIDNSGLGDVDFVTFTGLTPGAPFSVETMDPLGSGIDTYMGWFDDSGIELAFNDDFDYPNSLLSRIEGVVPLSGNLNVAVTGYGDELYEGSHSTTGTYELQLSVESTGLPGDFDFDDDVDGDDFLFWQANYGVSTDGDDLLTWEAYYGTVAPISTATTVPEPSALLLAIAFALTLPRGLRRSIRSHLIHNSVGEYGALLCIETDDSRKALTM